MKSPVFLRNRTNPELVALLAIAFVLLSPGRRYGEAAAESPLFSLDLLGGGGGGVLLDPESPPSLLPGGNPGQRRIYGQSNHLSARIRFAGRSRSLPRESPSPDDEAEDDRVKEKKAGENEKAFLFKPQPFPPAAMHPVFAGDLLLVGSFGSGDLFDSMEARRRDPLDGRRTMGGSGTLTPVPVDDLFAGIGFCQDDVCRIVAGRSRFESPDDRIWSDGDTMDSGIHLDYGAPGLFHLRLTPLFLMAPEGRFVSEDLFGNLDPGSITSGASRWRRDIEENRNGHGSRFRLSSQWKLLRLAFHYSVYREPCRDLYPGEACDGEETLARSGFGSGVFLRGSGSEGHLQIAVERSAGKIRSSSRSSPGGTRRLDGYALRSEALIRSHGFTGALELFLPEPERPGQGAKHQEGERSGYVLPGGIPRGSPLLQSDLDLTPAPLLCDRRNCDDAILKGDSLYNFHDHAAMLSLRTGYEGRRLGVEFSVSLLRPLAKRGDMKSNPFRRLRRDPLRSDYLEPSLRFYVRSDSGTTLSLLYSLLYLRDVKTQKRFPAGQEFQLLITVPLFRSEGIRVKDTRRDRDPEGRP